MHVLTVCYGHPADPAAFDSYYASTHAPLAEKIPGMTSYTYRHCASLDGSQPPYYLLAELSFISKVQVASWYPGARQLTVAVINPGPQSGSVILR